MQCIVQITAVSINKSEIRNSFNEVNKNNKIKYNKIKLWTNGVFGMQYTNLSVYSMVF